MAAQYLRFSARPENGSEPFYSSREGDTGSLRIDNSIDLLGVTRAIIKFEFSEPPSDEQINKIEATLRENEIDDFRRESARNSREVIYNAQVLKKWSRIFDIAAELHKTFGTQKSEERGR